jgi:hypothetical protein
MKTILKVILPVLAFTLASAAAVSTNDTKIKESKKVVSIIGYLQNPSEHDCDPVSVECTTVNTGPACMTATLPSVQAFAKDASGDCNENLYRIN